jgi:hypothetical protein
MGSDVVIFLGIPRYLWRGLHSASSQQQTNEKISQECAHSERCQGQQSEEQSVATSLQAVLHRAMAKSQESHRHQTQQESHHSAEHELYRVKELHDPLAKHSIYLRDKRGQWPLDNSLACPRY